MLVHSALGGLGAVESYASMVVVARRGHFWWPVVAEEAVEGAGGAVAQEGVGSAREHRRHRSGMCGGWEVADGVHAAVDGDQAP